MVDTRDNVTPRKKKCGAKNRQGQPCDRWAMNGAERCHMHGGKSLRGIAHPAYKDGLRSKYQPTMLVSVYHETRGDRRLLAIQEDLATLEAMYADLMETVRGKHLTDRQRKQVLDIVAERRQLIEAERRRQKEARELMTRTQALGMIGAVLNAVHKFVNIEQARLIQAEVQKTLTADVPIDGDIIKDPEEDT